MMSSVCVSDEYLEEVENLKEIFDGDDDFIVNKNIVEAVVKPEPKETDCYVCSTLKIEVSDAYPDCSAKVTIRNPRGLSPNDAQMLQELVNDVAVDMEGSAAIFQLIEETKTFLQEHNNPSTHCSICLEDLGEDQPPLIKTPCYHFFHNECIARHFYFWRTDPQVDLNAKLYQNARRRTNSDKEAHALILEEKAKEPIPCPVCRFGIKDENALDVKWQHLPPYTSHDCKASDIVLSCEMKQAQIQRKELFERQKEHNGINTNVTANSK
eukprot:m.138825 g.138825  ORF g.138825 m.138825 type:complete len:268 (+) comp17202_c0_seq1:101-904(+)